MINDNAKFEVTNDYIIVRQGLSGKYQILLFDRKNGKFLREIGKSGRGPGEYVIYTSIPFNPVRKEIYVIDTKGNILAYNINGTYTGKIANPKLNDKQPGAFVSMVDNDAFVMQVVNSTGTENRKLIILYSDSRTKIIPNKLTWNTPKTGDLYLTPPWGFGNFYIWDNKTNFVETYCDTLYQVTKESMIPRYFFNWGKYNAPYQIHATDEKHFYDYFYIINILENKSFIFVKIWFQTKYQIFYVEKANNRVTFIKNSESGQQGFYDDIDGLMAITPQGFTSANEMYWVIQPMSLFKWLKEDSKRSEMAYKKLSWLKEIDEANNPVIAIGKCID